MRKTLNKFFVVLLVCISLITFQGCISQDANNGDGANKDTISELDSTPNTDESQTPIEIIDNESDEPITEESEIEEKEETIEPETPDLEIPEETPEESDEPTQPEKENTPEELYELFGEYCQSDETRNIMPLDEAKQIASEKCIHEGTIAQIIEGTQQCNPITGTWWIDVAIEMQGCSPACVININTNEAEINYRCTGIAE